MKPTNTISLFLVLFLVTINGIAQEITCKLKGTVVGRDSKEMLLIKTTESVLLEGITIPIINNAFEYEIKTDTIEQYELIFKDELIKSTWKPVKFFPDTNIIEFVLYPSGFTDMPTIKGGSINKLLYKMLNEQLDLLRLGYTKMEPLHKLNMSVMDEIRQLNKQMEQTQNTAEKEQLNKKLKELNVKHDKIRNEYSEIYRLLSPIIKLIDMKQMEYIKNNINLYSYSIFLNYAEDKFVMDLDSKFSLLSLYSNKYPNHPYTKIIGEKLNALRSK